MDDQRQQHRPLGWGSRLIFVLAILMVLALVLGQLKWAEIFARLGWR